jgi:hypothetical protein
MFSFYANAPLNSGWRTTGGHLATGVPLVPHSLTKPDTDYTASNELVNDEWKRKDGKNGRDVEESDRGLFQGIITAFSCRD